MNCKQVDELLPLYVGHDLEDERAGLINAHLEACPHCARSAEEYVAASQLTQQFAAPQFSEAMYASVRHNVLREIEQESGRLTLRGLILGAFQPRLTWAVSTAVLLAVCAFAYYFVANRQILPHDQKAKADIKLTPRGTAGGSAAPGTHSSTVVLNEKPSGEIANDPGTISQKSRFNRRLQLAWHPTRSSEPPTGPVKTAQSSPEEPDNKPLNASVSSGKPMRLELQTKDPNIRIIWFSQPSTNEGSPQESSKGI